MNDKDFFLYPDRGMLLAMRLAGEIVSARPAPMKCYPMCRAFQDKSFKLKKNSCCHAVEAAVRAADGHDPRAAGKGVSRFSGRGQNRLVFRTFSSPIEVSFERFQ